MRKHLSRNQFIYRDSKKGSIDNESEKESIHESEKESIFPEINPYTGTVRKRESTMKIRKRASMKARERAPFQKLIHIQEQ